MGTYKQEENVVALNQFIARNEVDKVIREQVEKKSATYRNDFKLFETYCTDQSLSLSFESMEAYLLEKVIKAGLKLNTFNRRAAAIKHFLLHVYDQGETATHKQRIASLRKSFDDESRAHQKRLQGKQAKDKGQILAKIGTLENVRAQAITLVNLVTAGRPSEMVRMKVQDFDLEKGTVAVYLKKQSIWHTKHLTPECVAAVQSYVELYQLAPEHYLVGEVNKGGNYTSKQISETAYRKSIRKWMNDEESSDYSPYTFRKTQITSMYQAGAGLPTIAKQSGHKSLQTINEHYISTDGSEVKKFL